jgi:uncharacterized protein YceK
MKTSHAFILVLPLLLSACASVVPADNGEPPLAFHDTRLLYALAMGEQTVLQKDFGMKSQPEWAERSVAWFALPVTAATETAFYPAFAAIKAFAPTGHSTK